MEDRHRGAGGPATRERPISFLQAAAFQWVNPKAWIICAGAVSGFLQADRTDAISQALLFAGLFALAGFPCLLIWLAFGAAMQRLLRTDRALRGFNVAMGLVLAASVGLLI